ncbi:hypothetical protein B0A48_02649 [Cryoendolithus antarcticus]|uniref:Origin recognition complex subunit 1 n=1 Tax=Cryoendolithus antarcticus TaxID=1507870 RepID=A0A1V8TKV1_9PEZI|nr:hypothetical protein B0A48_02649 [Cryoendolithus antarcticus]
MPPKRKRTNAEKARHYLSGGGVLREDSDDELGLEDHPWEFIYGDIQSKDGSQQIVGARMGTFECYVGDTVLLKAPAGNEAWVAMIYDLSEGEIEDEDGDMVTEKKAMMLWFSSEKEIRSKNKRTDFLQNELYITANFDENPLTTINGRARVVSKGVFNKLYPTAKVPRQSKDYGKIFVCRRGANTRTATYTDEFIWEDLYSGRKDLQRLADLVETQTVKSRKRRAVKMRDLDDFVQEDEDASGPTTPRKKRKLASGTPTPSKAKAQTPRKLMTPTRKRIITKKALEFTPLGTRIQSPNQLQASPYQIARSTLHVSAVPHALPCRETEFDMVQSHLEAAITAGTGSCIYISGTPGTGKTATVREVVASLQAAVADEQLDDFYFVEINGMKVTDPHQSYSLLWEALKGDRVSSAHALELLEQEFTTPSPRRVPCVVLMDELDQLVTRNQGVMYNFFNWPQLRHSRLIVLAVANTMDLPERTLSNKISSRLGLTRITFPGYTHTQLMTIIQSRLEGVGAVIVESDAIQFASRKVAAVSGDARRALDICRRAVEIAEQEATDSSASLDPGKENLPPDTPSKTPGRQKPQPQQSVAGIDKRKGIVTIATIRRAINEATSTPLAAYLRALPLSNKLFLSALLARSRRTGITESTLADVADEALRMARTSLSKPVQDFLLTPPPTLVQDEGIADLGADAQATPGKRGRPVAKKELESVARVLGLGAAGRELAEAGIVGLESRCGERVGRIRLGVSDDAVREALREDEESIGLGF